MTSASNTRRVWWAIGIGTVMQVVSYGAILFGALVSRSDNPAGGGAYFALGFVLAPATFAIVAFVSGNERAPVSTLKAMGIWLIATLPLSLLNPVTGLCIGFTAAAGVTLWSEAPNGGARSIATVLTGLYVTILVLIIPGAGIFAGAVSPLLAIRAADLYAARRRVLQ